MRRTRGLTLVEALVAVALSTILVGIVAAVAIQTQKTIDVERSRQAAAEHARALFRDIELDLARMIPCIKGPPPFDKDPRNPPAACRALELERLDAPTFSTDPLPLVEPRRADSLRVLATIPQVATDGTDRALIEYSLDTGASGPALVVPPGGGFAVGRLRRHIVARAALGASSVTPESIVPPALVENVISFQIEWLAASALGIADADYLPPNAATASGEAFAKSGKVSVADDALTAVDAGGTELLNTVPIGHELRIVLDPASDDPGLALCVRRRIMDTSGKVSSLLVNDRLEPRGNCLALAFLPPPRIRVTLTLAFGRGQTAQTARFVRIFPLS